MFRGKKGRERAQSIMDDKRVEQAEQAKKAAEAAEAEAKRKQEESSISTSLPLSAATLRADQAPASKRDGAPPSSRRSSRRYGPGGVLLKIIRQQDIMGRKRSDEEKARLDFAAQLGVEAAKRGAGKVDPGQETVIETVAVPKPASSIPHKTLEERRIEAEAQQKKEGLVNELFAHLAKAEGNPQALLRKSKGEEDASKEPLW